jgi:hypothetical protein
MTMDTSTFQRLQKIRDKYGPGIFGKITQKLLALAFYEAGFEHIVERSVQGVDLDAAADVKYALEVKTTESQFVRISVENIDALRDRAKDSYTPIVAVLRMQMFEDWVFAAIPLGRLQPGSLPLARLRPYRLKELETKLHPKFKQVVSEHFGSVLSRGEHYLIETLAQKRAGQMT